MMKRFFYSIGMILAIVLAAMEAQATCRVLGSTASKDFVFHVTQNEIGGGGGASVRIECRTDNNAVIWYNKRNSHPSVDNFQTKLETLFDEIEVTNRQLGAMVMLYEAQKPNVVIQQMDMDFGQKNVSDYIVGQGITSPTIGRGLYTVNAFANISLGGRKRAVEATMTRNDARPVVSIGGVLVTYAIDYENDENLPPAGKCIVDFDMRIKSGSSASKPHSLGTASKDELSSGRTLTSHVPMEFYRNISGDSTTCKSGYLYLTTRYEPWEGVQGSVLGNEIQLENGTSIFVNYEVGGTKLPADLIGGREQRAGIFSKTQGGSRETAYVDLVFDWKRTSGKTVTNGPTKGQIHIIAEVQ